MDKSYRIYRKYKDKYKFRTISAPNSELKQEQKRILNEILINIPLHRCAAGFVDGKNIKDNALSHVGAECILNIDLRNFFDTITKDQVYKALISNGLSEEDADYISDICTLKGRTPQGAPTSPILSNIVAKPMDKKIYTLCKSMDITYTRYADDLTFSGASEAVYSLFPEIQSIVNQYGWEVNRNKVTTNFPQSRKLVNGIVVNVKPNIPKEVKYKIRAIIDNLEKDVLSGKYKSLDSIQPDYVSWSSLYGYATFMASINPIFEVYRNQLEKIRNYFSNKC
jgi:RNA-directed DNA polymerase